MPAGVVAMVSVLVAGFGIRHAGNRWAWIACCSIPGITGAALMSFLPHHDKVGTLVGIWLVSAITATLPMIYHLATANVSGYTKRAFVTAMVTGSFSIGNIIGPQTFQARDAPDYRPAKISVLATQAGDALVICLLALYYVWENRRRDAAAKNDNGGNTVDIHDDVEAWAGLTDKNNANFRYVI